MPIQTQFPSVFFKINYGLEQTLILQPDGTDGVDAYIQSSSATTNFGANTSLYVGEWSGAAFTNRSLIKFNLSAIPANAHIISANLILKVSSDTGATLVGACKMYRVKRTWVESEVTWNRYSTGNNWQAAGGFGPDDSEQTEVASLTIDPALVSGSDALTWTLNPVKVQEWTSGSFSNNGLLLKMETETDNDFGFFSSDYTTPNLRPRLEIIYEVPMNGTVNYERLANMPIAVDQHGFTTLDGLLYMAGGRATVNHSAEVHAYDPVTNEWTQKASLPHAAQSGALHAYNGKLYYIGGYNSQLTEWYGDVYEYDPTANTWTVKTSMPTVREDFGSALLDGKIYCFGGLTGVADVQTPVKVLEIYDINTDTWDTTKADMPDFKFLGDFGVSYNGKVYAIGGTNTFANYPELAPRSAVYEYDPIANTWASKAGIPMLSCYKEIVVLNNRLYAVSGATINITTYTGLIYSYDPATDSWRLEAPWKGAPYSARGSGLTVLNGYIYMSGGFNGSMLNYLYRMEFG